MDGFHLTRAQLSAMPDPTFAHARRGAVFTFDGDGFLSLVQAVRQPIPSLAAASSREGGSGGTIFAPGFDHAVKDPVEGSHAIEPHHRVVVFEGNYVVLDREPWSTAAGLMDERWFVAVDPETAKRRLVRRHVAAGIAADEAEAEDRANSNDLVNGETIVNDRLPVDEKIVSREDGTWC
jgi:pantothenate kinase